MSGDIHEMYRDVLRGDFMGFAHRAFVELNPQTPFVGNFHLEIMAAKLELVRRGKITRLIIALPPRHLKSHMASVAFPAWILGHDPTRRIVCVSYTQDLADKMARESRTWMTSPMYRALFPTRVSAAKQAVHEFETTRGGFRFSTSVGGEITGRGGDMIIIDDPMKAEDAYSEAARKNLNEWYGKTLYSRLNDKEKGAIVIVMQRLHEDDLIGHVLQQEAWDVVSFPAIAEADEAFEFDTPFGRKAYRRSAGGILHPARESEATLVVIRKSLGGHAFAAQYQQNPQPEGGSIVKRHWFKRYARGALPKRFDLILQSWDTATKMADYHAFSVCTTWGLVAKEIYLLDVLRRQMEYPELKRMVVSQAERFKATTILIEDKASGTQLIQELHEAGLRQVVAYQPEGDKQMRLVAQTPTIENGFVHIPDDAPWLTDYLRELTSFPGSKYADQVDSTTQALAWINMRKPEPGILVYYQQLAKQALKPQSPTIQQYRVKSGTTQFVLRSGQMISVAGDGTVELSEKDAEPLLRGGHLERIE